jgi:ADP-ribosyl-[dinitrogen reductase] hydrolase
LATGDALGAPVEFSFRDRFPEVREMMSGGKFNLPAGGWTDDTAMALCLAQSLLAHPEVDAFDLLTRFWEWAETGKNSSTGQALGFGQNTLHSLMHFQRTGALKAESRQRRSDGNGSIMRLGPLPIVYVHSMTKAQERSRFQSYTTHASDIAADACELLTILLCRLMQGRSFDEALAEGLKNADGWHKDIANIAAGSWRGKSREAIMSTGYTAYTLEAACWAVGTTDSFEEALVRAVNLGFDADTVAAVTGQIAGALYGKSAIPERWLCSLAQQALLEDTTQALIELSVDI